ncbi:fumarate hydratase [uncultured Clostridium sp.]|jgi:fumarate hydratase subunit alpha|uniref:fumarate hydratase n=1 Tax=uncultured Clostridium sp. TaxID=59620 RepID=UPI00260492B3|nr:fumarate hydratase [uncultured Clostridium sp.]
MREINVGRVKDEVKRLAIEAAYYLPNDIKYALKDAREKESFALAKDILVKIEENYIIAETEMKPLCQDTGMACIFIEIGQDVRLVGGNLESAINSGIVEAYEEGFLRKSVVKDPIRRINTKDNSPAIIDYKIVDGDRVKVVFAAKGFGSENMSRLKMLKPSDGIRGVKEFILETIELASGNPCPPIVVGVGIGGNFDRVAKLAKQALIRDIDIRNNDEFYADLEVEMLEKINSLGIGPQGFGGKTTAIAVNVETFPTHIAGLPVAVNINCHSTRHKEVII